MKFRWEIATVCCNESTLGCLAMQDAGDKVLSDARDEIMRDFWVCVLTTRGPILSALGWRVTWSMSFRV